MNKILQVKKKNSWKESILGVRMLKIEKIVGKHLGVW